MKLNFIQLLIARLQSQSPEFYKRMRKIAFVGAILCGAILAINEAGIYPVPAQILQLAHDIGAGLTAVFGVSFTGTTDKDLLNNENKPQP